MILGDQLDRNSAALDGFDPARDRIWMAEVAEESTHVPSREARVALFLAAMRHFTDELRARGGRWTTWPWTVTLSTAWRPPWQTVWPGSGRHGRVWVRPGEHRFRQTLTEAIRATGVDLEERPDRRFISTPEAFAAWAGGRQALRLEYCRAQDWLTARPLTAGRRPLQTFKTHGQSSRTLDVNIR